VISPTQRFLPDDTQHPQETDIHAPAGFEAAIPTSKRPQTHALDCKVTAIGDHAKTLQKQNALVSDTAIYLRN